MALSLNESLVGRADELDGLRRFAIIYAKTVHPYLALGICLISLTLNCLNCIILFRKQIIAAGNTILIHLAFCDIVKTIAVIPTLIVFYIVYKPGERRTARQSFGIQLLRLVMDDVALTGHTVSLWLAMLLALQRLICTRSRVTVQNNRLLKQNVTRTMVAGVYLFVIVLLQPTYWGLYLKAIDQRPLSHANSSANQSASSPQVAAYYIPMFRPGFGQVVYWFFAVGYKIVPCCLLTGFSVALIRTLFVTMHNHERLLRRGSKQNVTDDHDSAHKAPKSNSHAATQRKRLHASCTKMLVTIVLLMIVTQLPAAILVLCAYETYKHLVDLFDLLSLINNATNFLLYCKMSAAFRAEFMRLVCCQQNSGKGRDHVSTTALYV